MPTIAMRIAVVVPTLDEECLLPATLDRVESMLDRAAGDLLIVADGGSRDRTVELAAQRGALVISGPPGRGGQLRRGADAAIAAGAEALVFLHADTLLPVAARSAVVAALQTAVAGGFTVRFCDAPWSVRTLGSRLVSWRTRWLHLPLGDQAQFFRASIYQQLGGYPDWPLLEDVAMLRALHRRCRKTGERVAIIRQAVITSGRRFRNRGALRALASNWWILLRFALGASPNALAAAYRVESQGGDPGSAGLLGRGGCGGAATGPAGSGPAKAGSNDSARPT